MTNDHPFHHRSLYRSRKGVIFGLCEGLARYAGFQTFWVRFLMILATVFTGFWPMILIYIVASIFIKPEPLIEPENYCDWEFYNSYSTNRKFALCSLRDKFEGLERRTRRLEDIVTKPEYSWDRRFDA